MASLVVLKNDAEKPMELLKKKCALGLLNQNLWGHDPDMYITLNNMKLSFLQVKRAEMSIKIFLKIEFIGVTVVNKII